MQLTTDLWHGLAVTRPGLYTPPLQSRKARGGVTIIYGLSLSLRFTFTSIIPSWFPHTLSDNPFFGVTNVGHRSMASLRIWRHDEKGGVSRRFGARESGYQLFGSEPVVYLAEPRSFVFCAFCLSYHTKHGVDYGGGLHGIRPRPPKEGGNAKWLLDAQQHISISDSIRCRSNSSIIMTTKHPPHASSLPCKCKRASWHSEKPFLHPTYS